MKKIILALSAIALVVSCSQSRKWTDKERDEVRKVVRDRHDRSAIRHMEAKNYTNLEECVVTTIEETYPDYNRFDKLTGKTDTVDAVIVDKPVATSYAQENAGFTILDEELGAEQYGIAFRSGDQELCDAIEGAVQQLVDNGTYAKIAAKYPDIVNNLTYLNK